MSQTTGLHHDHEDELVDQGAAYLKARLPLIPKVCVILGSGLGGYAEQTPHHYLEEYDSIPGFTPCSVTGHRGQLVLSERQGVPVILLQGRAHRYEGHSLQTVTRPIRVLAKLGVTTMFITCAAGSVTGMAVGSLMLVTDHLNCMGDNPLLGRQSGSDGTERFVEMAEAYDPQLLQMAKVIAKEKGIAIQEGVLAAVLGPNFETKAEAMMLQRLGAHAVTMSTVPEVIMARAEQLSVFALALISNESGQSDNEASGHQDVLGISESKADIVGQILDGLLWRVAFCLP